MRNDNPSNLRLALYVFSGTLHTLFDLWALLENSGVNSAKNGILSIEALRAEGPVDDYCWSAGNILLPISALIGCLGSGKVSCVLVLVSLSSGFLSL